MGTLKNKTIIITGASRGIGRAIAVRMALDGANIVILARTDRPRPKLPGTIHAVAEEVEKAGGKALALKVDIRDEQRVKGAVEEARNHFGGIDILVNNASAIFLADTLSTPMKRFDLMVDVNLRGTFSCTKACIPDLLRARNPHILNLAPPLSLNPRWFKQHTAYTISKYSMSMYVLGMAEEFRNRGIAVNALWPRTVIDTAALAMLEGKVKAENCRSPQIVADAAHAILIRGSRVCTGNFFIDEEVLAQEGITDLSHYAIDPEAPLYSDLFID
ncbi:MAG: NAD(P)-dependent oxidoreductase [Pseudomonadota bacterium]